MADRRNSLRFASKVSRMPRRKIPNSRVWEAVQTSSSLYASTIGSSYSALFTAQPRLTVPVSAAGVCRSVTAVILRCSASSRTVPFAAPSQEPHLRRKELHLLSQALAAHHLLLFTSAVRLASFLLSALRGFSLGKLIFSADVWKSLQASGPSA